MLPTITPPPSATAPEASIPSNKAEDSKIKRIDIINELSVTRKLPAIANHILSFIEPYDASKKNAAAASYPLTVSKQWEVLSEPTFNSELIQVKRKIHALENYAKHASVGCIAKLYGRWCCCIPNSLGFIRPHPNPQIYKIQVVRTIAAFINFFIAHIFLLIAGPWTLFIIPLFPTPYYIALTSTALITLFTALIHDYCTKLLKHHPGSLKFLKKRKEELDKIESDKAQARIAKDKSKKEIADNQTHFENQTAQERAKNREEASQLVVDGRTVVPIQLDNANCG